MSKVKKALGASIVAGGMVLSSCGKGGSGGGGDDGSGHEKVTLTFVTAFPEKGQNNDGFWIFRDTLEEKAPWIEIDYRGGPEVVDPTDLIEGVSSGTYDGGHVPGDYYAGQMPLMDLQRFTPYSPMEERDNGIFDLLEEAHEKMGVQYVGHTHSGVPQVLMLKDKISSASLKGKSIRASAAATNMVSSLGGTSVDMPGEEVFTALERGVIDGTVWASVGPSTFGFDKEVNYYVEPRWYESVANTVINSDTWESLDKETQKAINEAMVEAEPKIFKHYKKLTAEETATWEKKGVKRIDLSKKDEEKMLDIAYNSAWDDLKWKDIVSKSPQAEELREIYEKGYTDDLTKAVPGRAHIEAKSK